MAIYGVCNHRDGGTRLCSLEIEGPGPELDHLLPCTGWRPFQAEPGVSQAAHPTPVTGITAVLTGGMDVSVDSGALRRVNLRAGDLLILVDTRPPGHAVELVGPERLTVFGITFAPGDFGAVRETFRGWPADMVFP